MSLTMFLTTAYLVMGGVGALAYVPQLLKLLRDKGRSEEVPLLTWLLWGAQTMVVFTYATVVNGDLRFILVNLFSMLACNVCLGMLLYNRFWKPLPAMPVAENVVSLHTRQVA